MDYDFVVAKIQNQSIIVDVGSATKKIFVEYWEGAPN